VSLGDLARYEEMIFASSSQPNGRDFSKARGFYLKAKAIAPKSSRAYHQLAIIGVYTKRRLDACYYYFRCMEVTVPLMSVRQALMGLFDEARIKSEAILFKGLHKKEDEKNKKKLKRTEETTSECKQSIIFVFGSNKILSFLFFLLRYFNNITLFFFNLSNHC